MTEKELKKVLMETKIEIESLKILLIQRGGINSFDYEKLKGKIAEEFHESRANLLLKI